MASLDSLQAQLQALQHVRLQCGADLSQYVDELAADVGLGLPVPDLAVDGGHLSDHAAEAIEMADPRSLGGGVVLPPMTLPFLLTRESVSCSKVVAFGVR